MQQAVQAVKTARIPRVKPPKVKLSTLEVTPMLLWTGEPRQRFVGEVIKIIDERTVKVRVEKTKVHQIVNKPIKTHRNFMVHTQPKVNNIELPPPILGDLVEISSCRKLSTMKNFLLTKVVSPAARHTDEETGITYSQVDDKYKHHRDKRQHHVINKNNLEDMMKVHKKGI